MSEPPIVRVLTGTDAEAALAPLSDILLDCVEGGASVSFMAPMERATADGFWRGVAAGIAAGERIVLAAEDPGTRTMLGTVQIVLAQPENQPHRADLAKMLVRRAARNRGVGAALMRAAEAAALAAGRTLLVLDTASDAAERLYARAGWVRVGTVPGYALLPHGGLCDTVFYYKQLAGG